MSLSKYSNFATKHIIATDESSDTRIYTDHAVLSMPGVLSALTGTLKWIAPKDIIFHDLSAIVSVVSTEDIVLNVNKNGVLCGTITILADQTTGESVDVAGIVLTNTDYLTVDLLTNGGEDLTLSIRYN